MGLFGRSRKMNNAATGALPQARPIIQPGPTTIHNHGVNWFSIILGALLCVLILLPVGWLILTFLFEKMGGSEKEAALLVVSIPVVVIAGWLLNWLIPAIVLSIMSESNSFKLEMAREITRREEIRLLGAQTTLEPSRYTEDDYQFARVILAVMETAYSWLEREGYDRFPARARPWSKTKALETAERIGIPITHDQALSVAKWLADEGIITAPDLGQISKNYPTLSSVKAHLDNKYGRPIVVMMSPTLRDNRGYVPIKN